MTQSKYTKPLSREYEVRFRVKDDHGYPSFKSKTIAAESREDVIRIISSEYIDKEPFVEKVRLLKEIGGVENKEKRKNYKIYIIAALGLVVLFSKMSKMF